MDKMYLYERNICGMKVVLGTCTEEVLVWREFNERDESMKVV